MHTVADFINLIDSLCVDRGLYRRELCVKIGISPSTLSKCLTNNHFPTLETVEKIADFLNVSIVTLLGLEREAIPPEDKTTLRHFLELSPETKKLISRLIDFYYEEDGKSSV